MPALRSKQQEVLEPLRSRYIHGDPPGTGKTPVGLRWLRAHEVERALLVVPTNVLRHWERLAPIWFPELLPFVVPTKTTAPKRLTIFEAAFRVEGPSALIVPYSVLRQDQEYLKQLQFDAFLADESHRLKGRGNLVQKAAVKIARRTENVELASGSVILNGAEEMWSSLNILDPKRYTSFWRWAEEHFYLEQTTFHGKLPRPITLIKEPRPGALEAIRAEAGLMLVSRPEEEVLPDLPDVVEVMHEVDLLPKELKVYKGLVDNDWVKVDGKTLWVPNEVAKYTRLRQLSSDWGEVMDQEEAGTKVKVTAELIEELHPRQVVVFTAFKSTARRLREWLRTKHKIDSALFTGDEDEDEREFNREQFISGEAQVLIGTFGAMAEGVDGLQGVSHHLVMIDREWTPELNRQAVGRLRRDGQSKDKVVVHHIVARDTIDQTIATANEEKREVIDAVVGHRLETVLHGIDSLPEE